MRHPKNVIENLTCKVCYLKAYVERDYYKLARARGMQNYWMQQLASQFIPVAVHKIHWHLFWCIRVSLISVAAKPDQRETSTFGASPSVCLRIAECGTAYFFCSCVTSSHLVDGLVSDPVGREQQLCTVHVLLSHLPTLRFIERSLCVVKPSARRACSSYALSSHDVALPINLGCVVQC